MNKESYTIAIANRENNKIYNVNYFNGTKKECINFINDNYYKYFINAMMDDEKVIINLAYNLDSVNHLDEWMTKKELLKEGVFKL